jgi:hypothetical protein
MTALSHITFRLLGAIIGIGALFSTSASAGRVNFTKYQKATASVHSSSYVADFAVDGIVSNFHAWRTGDNPGPHWLEMTYPRAVTLASAHLYSGVHINATPTQIWQNFRFQYHDGSGWIDIPGSTVSGNASPEINIVFSTAATSNRFRLLGSDNGNRTVRELAMFPPNLVEGIEQGFPIGTDVGLNLAYKRPATASSAILNNQFGPGYAKNAFDGYLDNKSRWICTAATGEWLEIDLLDTHAIGSAHVYTGFIDEANPARQTTQAMPNFKLQSWNGVAWTDIPGADITGNTQVARDIQFSSIVSTSRVRLVTTSDFNGRVQELLLFPPRAGGYELGREVIDAAPPSATWNDYSDNSFRLRCGISDGRFLGHYDSGVRFSAGTRSRDDLGWQLLLNHRDGSYRIRHQASGMCLALSQISFTDNTPVVLENYSGMPHQDWFLQTLDATHFRVVNAYSGMALQTRFSNWTAGNPMAVRAVDGSDLQRWRAQDVIPHPKKGIAATNNLVPWGSGETWMQNSYHALPKSSWSYSWGRQSSDSFPFMAASHAFNPMQWGDFNWTHNSGQGPIDLLRRDVQSNSKPVHLMGFNEPEKSGQGLISVSEAIRRWPRLEAMEVPLVSPVPANAFNGWLADFVNQANALGYRRDYTAVHWYGSPNAGNLISHLEQNYNSFGQRPVWLTEFSTVDWNQNSSWTHSDNYEFLAEFMWRAEGLAWLRRYSVFQFRAGTLDNPNQSAPDPATAPRSNTRNNDGTLTAFGELYAAWDGVTQVLNDKAYHIHNRGQYRRLLNSGTSLAEATLPEDSGSGTQWFLAPGITTNTLRIISTRDGRPLRFIDGGNVSFGNVGQSNAAVEWRLVPVTNGHGRHFIEHPATNKRLKVLDGVFSMVSNTNTGVDIQWRFINTLAPDPVAPPAIPTGLSAQATTSQIAVSWQPAAGAASYTVQRASDPAGPWATLASGITLTEWTDSGLPYATAFHYQVTAANGLGTSAPSETISATTEPEPLTLPDTPAGLAAQVVGTQVNLTWSPAARAASYTIRRSSSETGPWLTLAEGLGVIHWEDLGLAYGTTYYYTVSAVNEMGASDPSAPVSAVIAPHPLATYEGWAQMFLEGFSPADQQPDANPDQDSLNNLLEFVFLTVPTEPDGNPFKVRETNDGTITLEFPWNWRAVGYTWQVLHGADLSDAAAWPALVPQSVTTTREGDLDLIRVTAPMVHPDRGFFLLKVSAN